MVLPTGGFIYAYRNAEGKDLSKDAVFYLLLQSKSYTVVVCDLKSI